MPKVSTADRVDPRPLPATLIATDQVDPEIAGDNQQQNTPDETDHQQENAQLAGEYGYLLLDPTFAETKTYPYNGDVVMISDDPEKPGHPAIFYTTRRRGGHRWRLWQGWADPINHKAIEFEPICWRPPSAWGDWDHPIR